MDVYWNELPVNAVYAFNAIFDIQQMELLRGPQGTLRGRPAPAGAITVTTRTPDLNDIGGMVSGSYTDQDAGNLEAAINLPIIESTLALRLAGIYNTTEGPGGKLLNGDKPEVDETGLRATLLWDATTDLSFQLTHNYMDREVDRFSFVEGPGIGYNGPPLSGDDRRGVEEEMGFNDQEIAFTVLQGVWDLPQFRIVYVGGYQDLNNQFGGDLDSGNAIVNFASPQRVDTDFEVWTHELRLESTGGERFDYNIGLWYSDTQSDTYVTQVNEGLGVLGIPPDGTSAVIQEYLSPVTVTVPTDSENVAIFGHLDYHFTDRLTLGLGLRYLEEESERDNILQVGPGLQAIGISPGIPLGPLCPDGLNAALGFSPPIVFVRENYTGYCDLNLLLGSSQPVKDKWDEWVYDFSLKYALSDTTNLYFTAAHSWRPPGVTVGILTELPDEVIFGEPEESDSFEFGLKSEWLDNTLRYYLSYFHSTHNIHFLFIFLEWRNISNLLQLHLQFLLPFSLFSSSTFIQYSSSTFIPPPLI